MDKIKNEWENLCDMTKSYYGNDINWYIHWYENGKNRQGVEVKTLSEEYRRYFVRDHECYTVYNSHCTYEYWLKKLNKKNLTRYLYLTLSPDKFLRNLDNTKENRDELTKWCKNWFEYNRKLYGKYCWVIECGSKGDHLHVHAVVELLSSIKHARDLKRSWAKHFPKNQLLTSVNLQSKNDKKRGEYAYLQFDDINILQDKLDYFENEKKGSHENLEDLNLRGSRGFLTDNI